MIYDVGDLYLFGWNGGNSYYFEVYRMQEIGCWFCFYTLQISLFLNMLIGIFETADSRRADDSILFPRPMYAFHAPLSDSSSRIHLLPVMNCVTVMVGDFMESFQFIDM